MVCNSSNEAFSVSPSHFVCFGAGSTVASFIPLAAQVKPFPPSKVEEWKPLTLTREIKFGDPGAGLQLPGARGWAEDQLPGRAAQVDPGLTPVCPPGLTLGYPLLF